MNNLEKESEKIQIKNGSYPFKNKLVEAKDIVEIGLYFNILESNALYDLINILYDRENFIKDFTSLYPVSLYKLLIQYEWMQAFDRLIELEIDSPIFSGMTISCIISKYSP